MVWREGTPVSEDQRRFRLRAILVEASMLIMTADDPDGEYLWARDYLSDEIECARSNLGGRDQLLGDAQSRSPSTLRLVEPAGVADDEQWSRRA